MLSKSNRQHNPEQPGEPDAWRLCCISTSRAIHEELAPILMRCFPGAPVTTFREYPAGEDLGREFGRQIPDICFVDAISGKERALTLIPELLRVDSRINVIALLGAGEPELILKCLRLGAGEFLQQPFEAEQLQAALPKLARVAGREVSRAEPAKIYCVAPAKGACGATTVACNLAAQFKRSGVKRILLADMDPLTGTVSFLLKLKPAYSLADVLQRAETLDADLWKAMVTPYNGIDVLLAPELPIPGIGEMQDPSPVIEYARSNYDVVILDAGSAYGEWNLALARASDELLLVTTNELPALHGAQRSMSYLEANRVPRWKFKVIMNRFDKQVGLSKDVVASALHAEVIYTIPSDYPAVQKALIDGKPIPANSSLGKMFAGLANQLAGHEKEPPARTAPWGSLLSLFGRPG